MNKLTIILTIYITILSNALFAYHTEYKSIHKKEVLVGFYGRPKSKSLGILGKNNIEELVVKMREKQNYYKKELGEDMDVKMAFHIIHSLATRDSGRRNDYLLNISEESILRYIKRAKKENFHVILDVQLAVKTPKEAIKPLLKYLNYENVHIAIDPEFKIPSNAKYPPGKYVGSINAKQLNEAQELISEYLKEHNIKDEKKLIVHMFLEKMLKNKKDVKNYENISLIYNIDGFGKSQTKVKIYNALYAKSQTNKAIGGFKIFYKNDQKPLLSPKQILGQENAGNEKILVQPYYINYH